MQDVYIGLGSNIELPEQQIRNALQALEQLQQTRVVVDSGFYRSKPMGPTDQPDFFNAVVKIETALSPQTLLAECQRIERGQGRVKKRHWGERCIDLDILLYGDVQLEVENLRIPHPGIIERDFVYMPLLKLEPEIMIPGKGRLSELVAGQDSQYACCFSGNIFSANTEPSSQESSE